MDELKDNNQVTATLYADNVSICEVVDDKPYWCKEISQYRPINNSIAQVTEKLNAAKLQASQQAQRDMILNSLNVYKYNDYYPDEMKECPICGRKPKIVHHEAYDVYDIQCVSKLTKSPHLFVFGLVDESKKDVIDRWNKLVLDYEIDYDDTHDGYCRPNKLRRYI